MGSQKEAIDAGTRLLHVLLCTLVLATDLATAVGLYLSVNEMGVSMSLARVPDTAVEVRPTVSTATYEHAGHAGHAWPTLE
jgi:hypothetical protein